MVYEKEEDVKSFFEAVNEANIKYCLLKNVCDELPTNLQVSKHIDIIVHPEDKTRFVDMMKSISLKIVHPYAVQKGWLYLYGLDEFDEFRLYKGKDLCIDVTYK